MILCCLISFVLLALSTSVVSGRQQTCLSHVPPAAFAAQRSTENDERSFFKNPFASAPPKPELTTEETTKMVLDELGIEAMEPRVFYTDPDRFVDVATAFMPFIFRFGSGSFTEGYNLGIEPRDDTKYCLRKLGSDKQIFERGATVAPPRFNRGAIIIYEFEGCPFCRKVREALSMLSLEVEFRPCPQGSPYRKEIKDKYGDRSTFPFMSDPNTGVEMFESNDIIEYLFRTYGVGSVPPLLKNNILNTLSAGLGLAFRLGKGSQGRSSNPPELPLVLWTGEGSPYGKLVKEELCELKIRHVQISCPRGSPQRDRLFGETGRFQIPYLEDPNNGVAIFESSVILQYLEKMYGVEKPSIEYM